jgi:hypothetical protein
VQDQHTSIIELHQKHALVLSQAEAAASKFKADADAAAKRVNYLAGSSRAASHAFAGTGSYG